MIGLDRLLLLISKDASNWDIASEFDLVPLQAGLLRANIPVILSYSQKIRLRAERNASCVKSTLTKKSVG